MDDLIMLVALIWIVVTGIVAVIPISLILMEMEEHK